ncbi:MAG: FAD-dependent monooxygenase [Pseudomonadota bacterium]
MQKHKSFDILISGGGLAGLTAALALSNAGSHVGICVKGSPSSDNRTTALLSDSIDYLAKLGVWEGVSDLAYPLKTMRLVDATDRLFRFQQADFNASEIGIEAFGYNVLNRDLAASITSQLKKADLVEFISAELEAVEPVEGKITAQLREENDDLTDVQAGFIVGADGRNSVVRKSFGFGQSEWSYPQKAIVLDFEHQYSSHFTSTEFHTESGPFTIVPHSRNKAGLVWLEKPEKADAIKEMNAADLNLVLEEKMDSYLGKVSVVNQVQLFPISGLTAKRFGDGNHALIGEAAHVFPPIGAQGFNLGIRDVAELARVLSRFTDTENRGRKYHQARLADVKTRTIGVDLLNRSLIYSFLPVQMIRSAGIFALNTFQPLRKQAMKMGMSPIFNG